MQALASFSIALLYSALALPRNRGAQAIVGLALRQQLSIYARVRPRSRLSPFDLALWVALSRLWSR
jgi:isocitrate/isopropylmalate dehydrogenase